MILVIIFVQLNYLAGSINKRESFGTGGGSVVATVASSASRTLVGGYVFGDTH